MRLAICRSGGNECHDTRGAQKFEPTPHSNSQSKPPSAATRRASMLSKPTNPSHCPEFGCFQPHSISVRSNETDQPQLRQMSRKYSTFGLPYHAETFSPSSI